MIHRLSEEEHRTLSQGAKPLSEAGYDQNDKNMQLRNLLIQVAVNAGAAAGLIYLVSQSLR